MRDEILEQIDKLKMMILLDQGVPTKTDLEMYEEWVDKMQGRHIPDPWSPDWKFSNEEYAKYRTIRSLVKDLYHKKYRDEYEYHRDQPKITKIIAEVIAMMMFIQEDRLK